MRALRRHLKRGPRRAAVGLSVVAALGACSGVSGPAAPRTAADEPRLELSVTALDLTDRGSFSIRNRGDAPLEWRALEDLSWATVVPSSGLLTRGEAAVQVVVASQGLAPGAHLGRVRIGSNGGDAELTLRALVPQSGPAIPPIAPPVAPGPLPPPRLTDGFGGRVAGIFGLAPVAGATVAVGGVVATSDDGGWFATSEIRPGVQPITVTASGWVPRSTFAPTSEPLLNPLTLIPADFDLAAYDDLAREPAGDATVRWVEAPRIYVDARPNAGAEIAPEWLAAAEEAARRFPVIWSDGRLEPPVEVGQTPPPAGTPGTIVVRFDDSINPAGCGGRVGQAQFAWSDDGVILHAVISVAPARLCGASAALLRAVVGHELGHAMGLGHATRAGSSSLMEPAVRLSDASPLDRAVARLHYGRAPGHAAPDHEPAALAFLNFARSAGPSPAAGRTFVCDGAVP